MSETEQAPLNSVIVTEDGEKTITYEEYCDLLGDRCDVAFELANGFVFVQGDMAWFLPDHDMDIARFGSPLGDALLWDVNGYHCGDGKWRFSKQARADMEKQLATMKAAQKLIEQALAEDVGEDDE